MASRSSRKNQASRQRSMATVEGESYHSSCSSSGIALGGGKGGNSGSSNPVDKGGGGSSGKRGLARFSLRRLLYSSPLVGRRSGGSSRNGGGGGGMGFALGALGQGSRQQLQQALAAVVGGGGLGGGMGMDGRRRRGVDVEKGAAGSRHSAKGADARWGKPSRATRVSSKKDAKSKAPNATKSKGVSLVEDASSFLQVEDEESGGGMVEVNLNEDGSVREVECPLCLSELPPEYFPCLGTCMHRSCYDCFQRYLRIEISESRVAVACPQCSEPMHPNDIRMILNDRALYEKYEDFMVRRVLAVDPDTRWCPAPDCGFAVIASGCASCPRLKCERPGCGAHFCYHCKAPWHPDQTCDAARLERSQSPSYLHFHPHHHHSHHHHHGANNPSTTSSAGQSSSSAASSSSGASSSHGPGPIPASSSTSPHHRVHSSSSASFGMDSERGHHSHHHHRDDIKPCPRCQVLIVKMDDGSCNHMTCAVCGAEFCWLCMKQISDLHYLSPSGCTFWGKKPWSRKKKILWQLGTLVGAPVGIGLLAGIAVPAMIIGIPVWVGRKIYARYQLSNRHRRNLAIAGGVTASVVVSPVLAGLAVGIGVPILLFYVYGVVPVSLCRSGGCGVSTSPAGVRFDFDESDSGVAGLGVLGGGASGPQTPGADGSSTHGLLGRSGLGDSASVDTSIHHGAVGIGGGGVGGGSGQVGNPSIGEASLSLGSGSQLERLGRDDEEDEEEPRGQGGESGSNAALAGASLAGSIASSLLPGGQRLEVQADVAAAGSCSVSSSGRGSAGEGALAGDSVGREGAGSIVGGGQRLSVSSSGTVGSCTSGGVVLGGVGGEKDSEKCPSSKSSSAVDEGSSTGGASTRALAGSITLNFKSTDSSSLYHFRESPEEDWSLDGGGVSEGEGVCGPCNPVVKGMMQRGHGAYGRCHPTPSAHSAVGSARKCTSRRVPMDREGSDSSSWTGGEDGASSDRVRFDDHVRFIGGADASESPPSPLAQANLMPSHPLRSSSLSLQHAPTGALGNNAGMASIDSSIDHGGVGIGSGGVGEGSGQVGNPSIGEASLSLGSGSQLERLGRDDEEDEEEARGQGGESGSNAALAGASLAGSIASGIVPGGQRLDVQADVAAAGSCSVSSSGRSDAGESVTGDSFSREGAGSIAGGGQRLSVCSSGTMGSCTSAGVGLGDLEEEKDSEKCSMSKSPAIDKGSSLG
ncbi:E3 ubiquitin-protein ligase RNF19B-like isoform X2 [Ischnura elegans]|uniref:E3 ubiquitin-protein ligase RNF19B-like isoform X2 n=1 Tax=Ischnura elegans TaxID=197161 RepID=UPI001ED8894E|nr:E3 ubiquitin-protein ligase RNF19B-like isoform X2 [Ischnura elegans]